MYVLRLHKTLLFQVWHYWWYITCQNVGWNAGEKEVLALLDCAEIFLLRLLPSMLLYVVLTNKCIKKSSLKMVWRRAIHLKSGGWRLPISALLLYRLYFGSNDPIKCQSSKMLQWGKCLLSKDQQDSQFPSVLGKFFYFL